MSLISGIPHPFLNATGTGQQERSLAALLPDNIKIDDRKMVDILNFLTQFSCQVNFYNDRLEKQDWQNFFADSAPVLVANIYGFASERLEQDFAGLVDLVQKEPEPENIHHLLDFIYLELTQPLNHWQQNFAQSRSSIGQEINDLIAANLQVPIKRLMGLFNAVNYWYCLPKRSFSAYQSTLWDVEFTDLFARDDSFRNAAGGPRGRILALKRSLQELFQQFLAVIKELSAAADEHFEESLIPIQQEFQKRHTPHLGLLFTFLHLFEILQNDLNSLSKKHLQFFFKEVLGIQPRPVVPDQVHLILEIQKNLGQYLLKDGTQFKNGKDKNGNDVFYGVEEEVVLDQTQLASAKTLFVNRQKKAICLKDIERETEKCALCDFVEGVYQAPIANSADGKGEAFADPTQASWPTLGGKYSKFYGDQILLPTSLPEEHPAARIGFVVASPVLLLNEGKRTVTFRIEGKYQSDEDCELNLLNLDFTKIGQEGWKVFENCLTQDVLGLDSKGKDFLTKKIDRAAQLCFESKEELAAFLNVEQLKEERQLLLDAAQPGTPYSYLNLNARILERITLSSAAASYLGNLLKGTLSIDFENTLELNAFLTQPDSDGGATFSPSDREQIIEHIDKLETTNGYCLSPEIVASIPTLSEAAREFLAIKFTQRSGLCFSNQNQLIAFLEVKDEKGAAVFTDTAKEQILSKIAPSGSITSYCITHQILSHADDLSDVARGFLQNRIVRSGEICFDTEEEFDAFLTIKHTQEDFVFNANDRNIITQNRRDYVRTGEYCITRDTLENMPPAAKDYLIQRIRTNERICFALEGELDDFLAATNTDQTPIFSATDKQNIKDNIKRYPNRTVLCITQAVADGMNNFPDVHTYLNEQLQNTSSLCFENDRELDAFFTVKDENDALIFNDAAEEDKKYIRDNRVLQIIPGTYCITREIVSGLSESATDYLNANFEENERLCFSSQRELEAFLNLQDSQDKGVFDEEGKIRILHNAEKISEVTDEICISKTTLKNATYLSQGARDEIVQTLQRNTRYCFESQAEVSAFLSTLNENGEPIFDQTDITHIEANLSKDKIYETTEEVFTIKFSGAEDWVTAQNFKNRFIPIEDEAGNIVALNLEIEGVITDDQPAITFADAEILQENFQTHLPLAKIELNNEVFVTCEGAACPPLCELERCTPYEKEVDISLYHFLKDLKFENFCIDVSVCGLRNLVVQNDEALQDVNAPIFPFGTRPSIDSNFYIGSQEVFCKNWQKIWININWKDLPRIIGLPSNSPENEDLRRGFNQHYLGYGTVTAAGLSGVDYDLFKMKLAVIEEMTWKEEQPTTTLAGVNLDNPYTEKGCPPIAKDHRPLFETSQEINLLCEPANPFEQQIEVDAQYFGLESVTKTISSEPITQYLSDTQNGFMRLTMKCQDFQHREYPFVLARQMLAFGKFPTEFVFGAVYVYENEIIIDETGFNNNLREQESLSLFDFFRQIDRACEFALKGDQCASTIVTEIKDAISPSLLTSLRVELQQAIKDWMDEKLTDVDLADLLEGLSTKIDVFLATDEVTTAISDILHGENGFAAKIINGIAVNEDTLNTTALSLIEAMLSLLNTEDADDPVFGTFLEGIQGIIKALSSDEPEELDPLIAKLIDDHVNAILGGLSSADKATLQDPINGILVDQFGEIPNNELGVLIREEVTKLRTALDEETLRSLDSKILVELDGLDSEANAEQLGEFQLRLVNEAINEVLGGLDVGQTKNLQDQIRLLIVGNIGTEEEIEQAARQIVSGFIEAFKPNEVEPNPAEHWGDQLLVAFKGLLTEFVTKIKEQTTVDEALLESTIEAVRSMMSVQFKAFFATTDFQQEIHDEVGDYATLLKDDLDAPFQTVFEALELDDLVGLSRITQEVELCACGALESNCTVKREKEDPAVPTRFELIYNAEGTDLTLFEGSIENLIQTIEEYCAKLKTAKTETAEEKWRELKDAQAALENALTGGDEEAIAIARSTLNQAITAWNALAKPFVDFIDGLDKLSAENPEPKKLRAILPYVGVDNLICGLNVFLRYKKLLNAKIRNGTVAIPNEPYTPEIKEIALDYTASACLDDKDFKILHLYPFEGTHQELDFSSLEDGESHYLLPHHTSSGALFLGFENLRPGSNLQLLFQLAEATGNTELLRPTLEWEYLSKTNQWQPLRSQREILQDDTKELSTSGIVKIAIPNAIAKPQPPDRELEDGEERITLMPPAYRWIRVSAAENAEAFSETVGVFTQAVKVVYQPQENNDRENLALAAKQISALAIADSNIKKVEQPFPSFGGRLPEANETFNKRVSEHLRHKGRAITPFDYEHIILEHFPKVYRAKCISHSLGLPSPTYVKDLDVAPGFVNLAVIPDLNKLNLGKPTEPKIPISLLTEIKEHLSKINSPFARINVMNPRYEQINLAVTVGFVVGRDVNYYSDQLKEDLTNFLAPWLIGDFDQLNFGRTITRSSLIRFIEDRDYINFISELGMVHQDDVCMIDPSGEGNENNCQPALDCEEGEKFCQTRQPNCKIEAVHPLTARSILTAGSIEVTNFVDKVVNESIPAPSEA